MPMRATVNQQFQIGPEAIPGSAVPAAKLIEAFDVVWGIKPDIKTYRPTGRKLISIAEEMTEMTEGKLSGELDYNAVLYPVAGVFGKLTPTLHAGATSAYDYSITPPLTGNANPQTFTGQKGDASTAEQASYMLMSDWGYKLSRKEATNDASFIAQLMNTSATLTPSPTVVPLSPLKGGHVNVFLDGASAGIGTTQLANFMEMSFAASGYYSPFWAVNRANPSFGSHVDLAPKNEVKITLPADSQGKSLIAAMQAGSKQYMRVDAVGGLLENDQIVAVGAATAGTFTLSYKGQTTAAIAYNATAAAVQSALAALSTIGAGNVSVSGAAPTWTVQMTGALALDTTALTGAGTGLTGGAFSVTAAPVPYGFRHDMALLVTNVAQFSDKDGVYAIEYTFEIAEDSAWGAGGKGMTLSGTCALSAL